MKGVQREREIDEKGWKQVGTGRKGVGEGKGERDRGERVTVEASWGRTGRRWRGKGGERESLKGKDGS